jgi:hypothetical protein
MFYLLEHVQMQRGLLKYRVAQLIHLILVWYLIYHLNKCCYGNYGLQRIVSIDIK